MAHNNRPMRRSALIGPWGVGAIVTSLDKGTQPFVVCDG